MLKIEYRKIDTIAELENNPSKAKDPELKNLCKSISDNPEYFEARPCLLSDRTGKLIIIAGNKRYRAAKKIELKEVPTILMSGLTEAQEREITIRDNVSDGDWDYSALSEWEEPIADWGVEFFSDTGAASPGISAEAKPPYVEKTFIIKNEHIAEIDLAIKRAIVQGGESQKDGNKNGIALYCIAKRFNKNG
jgi:hypothetical protein